MLYAPQRHGINLPSRWLQPPDLSQVAVQAQAHHRDHADQERHEKTTVAMV
jgi:hypothetical protein